MELSERTRVLDKGDDHRFNWSHALFVGKTSKKVDVHLLGKLGFQIHYLLELFGVGTGHDCHKQDPRDWQSCKNLQVKWCIIPGIRKRSEGMTPCQERLYTGPNTVVRTVANLS